MTTRSVWIETLVRGDGVSRQVRLTADAVGTVVAEQVGVAPGPDDLVLGHALPGFGNAHSHAFHRALRGRTHDGGGDFWTWRTAMYRAANALDPDRYRELAGAVFTEMVAAGWTAVGEFHYVHHQPDGRPYPDHAMELALADAALSAGIRLVLLDTCYLAGGFDRPLEAAQQRFGDGSAEAWLERWHALKDRLARVPGVTLGAALHSVRAVPRSAIATALAGLPADTPLHLHLSEQPAENSDCVAAYGLTPTGLLAAEGALGPRCCLVHATHLTGDDIALIGRSGASVAFCPTTEADLGDGIGPALELRGAGARLALGSDQNAVIDPFLEIRGLEAGERLRSLSRGRLDPRELVRAATDGGYQALGLSAPARLGGPLDLVEVDPHSSRTAGAAAGQLILAATASDVVRTVVGGRVVAVPGEPGDLGGRLLAAIGRIWEAAS